jgi:DNA-binding SARP family transcriptional activator
MEGIFHLRFLGPVQVERDGEPVRGFRSRKALALLGYLAVQGQPVPRERLVDLFWGDKSEAQGRTNLNWVLGRISALLPGCLQTDRHTVQFQRAALHWLDIVAFEELEAQEDAASLADAVDLYRGEFLEGLYLDGCAEFEIWLVGERERWRQRVAWVLGELATHHVRRGEHRQGLRFARRLLALEPWREETHRQVMQLLAQSGQRGAALAQYETCRRALAEELGVEPAAETTRLFEQIRDGELEIPVSLPARRPPEFRARPPSFLDEEEADEQHPLVERPVFVARERELAQLGGFLDTALEGQGQVVFVTGEAGSGKTALVQEFARRGQEAHSDLIVAWGNCNAFSGVGDPYLPFRDVLGMLTGDVESRWAAGTITREHTRRVWALLPLALQALLDYGSSLIDIFVPGTPLLARAAAAIPSDTECLQGINALVGRKKAEPGGGSTEFVKVLEQSHLFEQYTNVLRALATRHPLLLILDDIQWADTASIGLLFHLGRRLEGARVLIVSAYRPDELALGRDGERHPLEKVLSEFKRHFGDVWVDLAQADAVEGRRFVDTFLDTEPNRLGEGFRDALFRHTGGHPLFTVEVLTGIRCPHGWKG